MSEESKEESAAIDCESFSLVDILLKRELTTYAQHDYFSRSKPISPDAVDPKCRYVMTKWCYNICKFCDYDRSMVASVMYCVDQFAATQKGKSILSNRNEYQLAVMTCLYLVTKVYQTQALEPKSMAKLSRGKYTKCDIEEMELEILLALKGNILPPTPRLFAEEFVRNYKLMSEESDESDNDTECGGRSNESSSASSISINYSIEEKIMELVNCQIEEAACDYDLSCLHRPSHVALGAIVNALESLNMEWYDIEYLQRLREQIEIDAVDSIDDTIDDLCMSLLRLVSSSDNRENSTACSLLIQRCGTSSSKLHDNSVRSEAKENIPSSSTEAKGSCSSPRTVFGCFHR